jgi:hypothetical protein
MRACASASERVSVRVRASVRVNASACRACARACERASVCVPLAAIDDDGSGSDETACWTTQVDDCEADVLHAPIAARTCCNDVLHGVAT